MNEDFFGWQENDSRLSIPVGVILERTIDPKNRWGFPSWKITEVITGQRLSELPNDVVTHDQGNIRRRFHAGLSLDLYKDGSEGYWYNLLSQKPFLFLICAGDYSSPEITPMIITANQDEATGHLESDDVVLSIAMPDAMTTLLERYVVANYQPEIRKKRNRKDWLEDSLYASQSAESADGKQSPPADDVKTTDKT